MAILNHGSTIRTADGGQSTATIVTSANIGSFGIATNSTYYIGTTQNVFNRASGAQTLTGVSIDGNAATVTNGVYTTGTQTIGGAKTFSDGIVVNGATYYTFNKPTTNAYQTVALFGSASAGLFLTTDSAIIGVGAYYNNGWIATATSGRQIDFAGGTFTFNAFSGATVGGAASWGTVAQLSSAGVFSATGDFRAPIFYDSNNTSYYLDPANTGTSLLVAGNVGIGATNPLTRLHVAGAIGLYQNAGSTYLYYDHSGVNTWRTGIFTDNTSTYIIGHDSGGAFATKIFAITMAGNVGIGTTSPGTKLDVVGAVTMPVIKQSTTLYAGTDITDDDSTRTVYFNIPPGGYSPVKYFKVARIKITGNYQNVSLNGYFTAVSSGVHVGSERKVEFDFIAYAATNPGAPTLTYLKRGPDTTNVLVYAVPNGGGAGTTYYDVYIRSAWYNDTNGELAIRAGYGSAVTIWQAGLDSGTSAPVDTLVNPNSNYTFDTTGNIGIGTTSPSQKLDVSGSINASTYVYAGIFYDNDNTAYYANPSGASIFNGLKLVSSGNEASGSDFSLWIQGGSDDWGIGIDKASANYGITYNLASSHSYAIQGRKNGTEYFRLGTDMLSHDTRLQAPIFYDSNNTAYYCDPARLTRNQYSVARLPGRGSFRPVRAGLMTP